MNNHTEPVDDAATHALAEEGRAVRDFIQSNRSNTLLSLFDFLLQQSLAGHRPKEAEIAEEVFQESWDDSNSEGSRVRVGIHRLRRKLDLYYADKTGPRIVIPKGEYGLFLKSPDNPQHEEQMPPAATDTGRRRKVALWIAALAFVMANVTLALLYFNGRTIDGEHALRSTLWRGFDRDDPTKIVVGDYFMFLGKGEDGKIDEPTQDLSIFDADGFYARFSKEAGAEYQIMEGNSYSVSIETLESVNKLWPVIQQYRPAPVSASDVNPDMMKSSNILFVGPLDSLTPLIGNPLFQISQFNCADTCYELVDKTSGKHFLSASPYLLADRIVPRHDYGYIASFPGPSGKQILIISGTGEAGVRQMASVATNPQQLQQLERQIGGKFNSFEALYQVRAMFSQSFQSSLLIAHPINSTGMWDKTKPMTWQPAPPFNP